MHFVLLQGEELNRSGGILHALTCAAWNHRMPNLILAWPFPGLARPKCSQSCARPRLFPLTRCSRFYSTQGEYVNTKPAGSLSPAPSSFSPRRFVYILSVTYMTLQATLRLDIVSGSQKVHRGTGTFILWLIIKWGNEASGSPLQQRREVQV